MKLNASLELTFHPLTAEHWPDLEKLFGPRGACAGCWCMWWRLSRTDFDRRKGEGNRTALKALVEAGTVPGLLAYEEPYYPPSPFFSQTQGMRSSKRLDW